MEWGHIGGSYDGSMPSFLGAEKFDPRSGGGLVRTLVCASIARPLWPCPFLPVETAKHFVSNCIFPDVAGLQGFWELCLGEELLYVRPSLAGWKCELAIRASPQDPMS